MIMETKRKMRGQFTKISSLYFGMFFLAIMGIGMALFMSDLYSRYNVETPNIQFINQTNAIVQQAQALNQTMQTQLETGNPLSIFVTGIYLSLKLFLGVGDLYGTFLTGIGTALQIPTPIIVILIAAVFTIIIFGIINLITWRTV